MSNLWNINIFDAQLIVLREHCYQSYHINFNQREVDFQTLRSNKDPRPNRYFHAT